MNKNIERIEEIQKRYSSEDLKSTEKTVSEIIEAVRSKGDEALKEFTRNFDKQELSEFGVDIFSINKSFAEEDFSKSYLSKIDSKLKQALINAKYRIRLFHARDLSQNWSYEGSLGDRLGVRYRPLDSVGIYVPGGQASLVSTVLMTAIPARVSGVKRIVMVSPPPISNEVLAAAELAGVDEVYSVGGAQAVAALAYGTDFIKPVDKIVGPGNIYVSLAKKQVFGQVGIDGIYGPSELAIVADDFADPKLVAADLLSQLEHGSGLESVLLVSDSNKLLEGTKLEFDKQLTSLGKSSEQEQVIRNSFEKWSASLLVENLDEAAELINAYAPEHLEIIINPKAQDELLAKVRHAGAIFLGAQSCESLGDYLAGPSHCLPTSGTARFSSGLQCADFLRKTSIIDFSSVDLSDFRTQELYKETATLARAEGLEAHAKAAEIRIENVPVVNEPSKPVSEEKPVQESKSIEDPQPSLLEEPPSEDLSEESLSQEGLSLEGLGLDDSVEKESDEILMQLVEEENAKGTEALGELENEDSERAEV